MQDKLSALGSGVNKNLKIDSDKFSNVELEKGETLLNDKGIFRIEGNKAKTHAQGGVPAVMNPTDFVFSNRIKVKGKEVKELFPWLSENKSYSIADISKSGPLKKLNEHLDRLASDNDIDKSTSELMTSNIMDKLSALSLIQEGKKGFPDGIPSIGEIYMNKLQSMQPTPDLVEQSAETKLQTLDNQSFMYGGSKRKLAAGGNPFGSSYTQQAINMAINGQYRNRPYQNLFGTGDLIIDNYGPVQTVKGQKRNADGSFGNMINQDVIKDKVNRFNSANLFLGNESVQYTGQNNNVSDLQGYYNNTINKAHGVNYYDDPKNGLPNPYAVDNNWGDYTNAMPGIALPIRGNKAGNIPIQSLLGKTPDEQNAILNEYGVNRDQIVEALQPYGSNAFGITNLRFSERPNVESLSNINSSIDALQTNMPTVNRDPLMPVLPSETSSQEIPNNIPGNEYTQAQVADTGYNMMESLSSLMSGAALNMPDIYPKRYENYGIPQAMGVLQNQGRVNLEAQREAVRSAASNAYNANANLSPNASGAAINNAQVAASAMQNLNQIEGQEFNTNIQRDDQRQSMLANLILNRGTDLMNNARQYNTEMDALRQNKYEDRLQALRGMVETTQNNYNNKLQRNLINSMYGDNMQIDAEGRVYMDKGTDITKLQGTQTQNDRQMLLDMLNDPNTDPKSKAVILNQLARSSFNTKR